MELNEHKIDGAKIDGIWTDFYDDPEAKFLIASTERTAYKKRIAALARKASPAKLRSDPTVMERITIQAMAEAILLDFKGVQEGGKALPNTTENRVKLLEVPSIRDFVSNQALDIANFQSGGEAEDASDLKSGGGVAPKAR